MVKETFKKNKTFWILSMIVLIIEGVLILSIYAFNSTGNAGYFQYSISNILCLIIGIPIFGFFIFLFKGFIISFIRNFKSYLMKNKLKFTKKGKKEVKSELFLIMLLLVPLFIGVTLCFFGTTGIYKAIQDKPYLEKPKNIVLKKWRIDRQRTWSKVLRGKRYTIKGKGENNKLYEFVIGKYSGNLKSFDNEKDITIYYLPNSEIIINVKQH